MQVRFRVRNDKEANCLARKCSMIYMVILSFASPFLCLLELHDLQKQQISL